MARYFGEQQAKVDEIVAVAEESTRAVEEYVEEHAVEDGLLADAMDDDKITKALVAARLKAVKRGGGDPEEVRALQHAAKLYNAEAAAKKAAKDAQAELDLTTLKKKYGALTEIDIEALVIDDKWQATAVHRIAGEVEALTLDLVARIQQLGERYAATIDDLDTELARIEGKVSAHLAAMGVER